MNTGTLDETSVNQKDSEVNLLNYTIFYSWQSDLPNNSNRSFIEVAIKKAIKKSKNTRYSIYLDYDRDTLGVTGSPDISETIFNKIDKTDIFICDISIINQDYEGRKTPNPNVLLELGYAAKVLGWEKIICLFNKKFGKVLDVPFDLNHKRILFYNSDELNEKEKVSKIISQSISEIHSKGILFNPIKDHIKGKVDFCLLEILKHMTSFVYGTVSMSESLAKVTEILNLTESTLNEKLQEDKEILGFFVYNNLNHVSEKLDDLYTMITTSNIYPVEWAITILKFRDWIRSYKWSISSRSNLNIFQNVKKIDNKYDVVSASKRNSLNPINSYILVKKDAEEKFRVVNRAIINIGQKEALLSFHNINFDSRNEISKRIWDVITISNEWLDKNGNEIILDPDYYHIGG
ncbi:hypothetical protein MKY75_17170 [Paenibacillus sp. FSL L8-0663]|uniref:hypothetical protein n=1 Tax=Paenibacillus sp. FSL L8-0663 TaxID=2921606 RepID=UPI0030F8CA3B